MYKKILFTSFVSTALITFVACNKKSTSSTSKVIVKGASSSDDNNEASVSGIDPSSVKLKIYKVGFYKDEYCTKLEDSCSASGDYQEMTDSPTLCSAKLSDGKYKCIAIEMSDTLKSTPVESSDNDGCVADEENDLNVCRGQISEDMDGDEIDCDDGDDRVTIYLSTASTNSGGDDGGNAFVKPTEDDPNNGLALSNAFVVDGKTTAVFVSDFTGKIAESGSGPYTCETQPPVFSFE